MAKAFQRKTYTLSDVAGHAISVGPITLPRGATRAVALLDVISNDDAAATAKLVTVGASGQSFLIASATLAAAAALVRVEDTTKTPGDRVQLDLVNGTGKTLVVAVEVEAN